MSQPPHRAVRAARERMLSVLTFQDETSRAQVRKCQPCAPAAAHHGACHELAKVLDQLGARDALEGDKVHKYGCARIRQLPKEYQRRSRTVMNVETGVAIAHN
jgi:hypothetical protein